MLPVVPLLVLAPSCRDGDPETTTRAVPVDELEADALPLVPLVEVLEAVGVDLVVVYRCRMPAFRRLNLGTDCSCATASSSACFSLFFCLYEEEEEEEEEDDDDDDDVGAAAEAAASAFL